MTSQLVGEASEQGSRLGVESNHWNRLRARPQ
jgi:hypothetical protein